MRNGHSATTVLYQTVAVMVLLSLNMAQAFGAPAYFSGSDHYYDVVLNPTATWDSALTAAAASTYLGTPGHLVTITSAAENNFVTDLMVGKTYRAWAGGFQPDGSPEPAGNWRWITGEPWGYTNWNHGEPNNNPGDTKPENALEIFSADNYGFWANANPRTWNDIPHTLVDIQDIGTFIVEYEVPEPATLSLLVVGLSAMFVRRKRQA